jgi:UDP-N-acetylmuramoylalanine--D-glutamate ligase
MELEGKRILIIGMGKTGVAAATFSGRRGARLAVTDEKPAAAWGDALAAVTGAGLAPEVRPYVPAALDGVDLVVPSPGVAPANPLLVEAGARGIPILSELELAARHLRRPMIAITGTNGKTTVTTLVGDLLKASGKTVFVGGNIGRPLIGFADGPQEEETAVVEVSSFQLQWTETFRPAIGILLNVTCDHVDYHGSFSAYREAKERLFARQEPGDLAILNADDPGTSALAARLRAGVEYFRISGPCRPGISLDGSNLVYAAPDGAIEIYARDLIRLPGLHNVENVMAAILACRRAGCPPEAIRRGIAAFTGIAHRIQFAGEKNGVAFYDDSKGTNVGAVARALETFSRPVVLLLGGRDKEGDFATLVPIIRERVKTLILFGEARERIGGLIGEVVATRRAATLKAGLEAAREAAAAGDVVLLSPGCASFDEFADYRQRGDMFQRWVKEL